MSILADLTRQLDATKTPEEVASIRVQVRTRLQELDNEHQGQQFDAPAQEEFAGLNDLMRTAQSRETEFVMRRQAVMDAAAGTGSLEAGAPVFRRTQAKSNLPDDLYDLQAYRQRTSSEDAMVALMVDGARKASDLARYPHERATDDRTKGHIHRLLETVDDPGELARHILATGNPVYARAFGKLISRQENSLTSEERAAIATVGTTTTGGYAVPYTLDPTLILTSDGAVSPLRQISRVEQITGNKWAGLTTAGVTVSRGPAENQPVNPSSVTFDQPDVTVQPVKAEIQFSIESGEDWPRLQAEMARVLQDAKDAEEADSFVNGVGTTVYPGGVVQTLDASSHVGTTGDGFDLEDVDRLVGRLPDRFEPRARFLGHRLVYGEIARLDRTNGNGSGMYQPLAQGQPATLKGYPAHNSSAMDGDYTGAGNPILLFGDFQNFLIVDKVGMTIELDPHVRDGNGKWTGQRALLAHWRNSSVILVDNAFRLLKVGVVVS